MAVIRTVSEVVNYNMDISKQELEAIIAAITYMRIYQYNFNLCPHKAELINLETIIKGAIDG